MSATGVKQGCTLSPTLSNIFQNDLHEIFHTKCDPVTIDSLNVNSMSWADDLVLVSRSRAGLQSCLDELNTYCNKWGLIINAKKTQCMIMARGTTKEEEPLTIGGNKLDYVGTYKYLGIIISRNGNIKNMIHDRVEKAKKAIFAVTRALKTTQNVSARLAISIFDKQIQPILTYGCQLWGIPNAILPSE